MPAKTWNMLQINVGGANPNRLWWGEAAAVTAATSASGWTVGKTAATNHSILSNGLEQAVSTFTATLAPNNTAPAVNANYPSTATYTPPTLLTSTESISTLYEYNGYFPAGDWTFNFPVIAVTSGGDQDGRIRMRVFKGLRSGTAWADVTELTNSADAALTGTTVTNLTTTTAQTSTVTWTADAFFLNYEFLIIKMAWQVTGATNTNNRDVLLRYGSGASMVSTNFRKRAYEFT